MNEILSLINNYLDRCAKCPLRINATAAGFIPYVNQKQMIPASHRTSTWT